MKIGFGSDHGGFELKNELLRFVADKGYDIKDYGTNDKNSVDYPVFAANVAKAILKNEIDRGIICCGTGIGISISANKFPGIRAALCHDYYSAKMSRLHNDSNILAMGGRTTGIEIAKEMVEVWLDTEFEGGRHKKRIDLIHSQAEEFWKNYINNK
jgi:ribose 5-phosphate isomerase B